MRSALHKLVAQEDINFLLTNRLPRRLTTRFMGWFSKIENPVVRKTSIAAWKLFSDLDLSEAKATKFKSMHDVFTRELKPGARPIDPHPEIMTSPCDAIVGAQVTHFDYLDCIYRRGANGESLYMEIYVPPHPEDASLAQNIADTISARILPDDMLVCQLSVGSHVDHVLVRQAAELLGHPLWYDIDIPYIFYKSEEFVSKSAQMRETTHFISNAGLRSWQEAVLQYASQLPALGEAMATSQYAQESILAYWSEWKGIRLFQER